MLLVIQVQAKSEENGASANGAKQHFDYDLFTIGAGSGGVRASRFAAANYGEDVACCNGCFVYVPVMAADFTGIRV